MYFLEHHHYYGNPGEASRKRTNNWHCENDEHNGSQQ